MMHTSMLTEGNYASDSTINDLSVLEERILITKDSDFYYSYLAQRKPYKLILVKLGNMRLKDLKIYFEDNAAIILSLMEGHSFLILEKERIRILE